MNCTTPCVFALALCLVAACNQAPPNALAALPSVESEKMETEQLDVASIGSYLEQLPPLALPFGQMQWPNGYTSDLGLMNLPWQRLHLEGAVSHWSNEVYRPWMNEGCAAFFVEEHQPCLAQPTPEAAEDSVAMRQVQVLAHAQKCLRVPANSSTVGSNAAHAEQLQAALDELPSDLRAVEPDTSCTKQYGLYARPTETARRVEPWWKALERQLMLEEEFYIQHYQVEVPDTSMANTTEP